jgi:hypothetical protein
MEKQLVSMKKRFLLPLVAAVGICVWLLLCHENYKSYWCGTINRVQTTDFNILHHTLPITLSQLIIADRDDLIQKTLDSNYGLFGLLVTDPHDGSVLYKTGKVYSQHEEWHKNISPEDLARIRKAEPLDLLTDPLPLDPAWEHNSPRTEKAVAALPGPTSNQHARVLGHLYYVRPDPPPFFQDILAFLSGSFEATGCRRGYLYITLTTMAFSCVALLMVWLKQRGLELKQTELDYMQRELDIRKKALENVSAELATQKARKIWLEKEADVSYKRALALKEALQRLKDALTVATAPHQNIQAPAQPQPHNNNFANLPGAEGVFKSASVKNPPSALLEEIEQLIPALTDNAVTLKSQASLLNDYCSVLEERQAEMKRIVDQAYVRTSRVATAINTMNSPSNNVLDMTP